MSLSALIPGWQKLGIEEFAARLAALPQETREKIVQAAYDYSGGMKWVATAGPQLQAYFCPADILLYGGSGGAGKSDLLCGLAMTAHRQSLLMRQQYNDLDALTERCILINGTRQGFNGSNPPSFKTADGRFIQFTGAKTEGWQGAAFDLKGFDEAVQILQSIIRFHLGWIRSTDEKQRKRAVLATNPPVNSIGDWIIPMFAPWLDITHQNPAKHGELRWYVKDPDGNDFEVPDNRPYQFPGQDRAVEPMSRTFIPGKLVDNPYLMRTGYQAVLDNLDEPLRSAVRDGNFMAARKDQAYQVLPTEWVRAAQKRWTKDVAAEIPMTCLAVDVGGGGMDRVAVARRHGAWFDKLIIKPGKECPDGSSQAGLVASVRRDGCGVVVDVGGGYGGDLVGRLKDNDVAAVKYNGSAGSTSRAKDGSGRIFLNKRAESWWRFREGLNPDQPGGSIIALPDDPEMLAELTAVTYIPDILRIQIEDKKDVAARLGRSPDKGDAIIMAYAPGEASSVKQRTTRAMGNARAATANVGYSHIKRTQ
jgi:hypothetical protein